jgi:hypothetical protein
MSTTRGVLFVHSAPSALCPHIDWAVGGVFGAPTRLDWSPQPVERSTYRAEHAWVGPQGSGARIASALKGWQRVRFEVTEEATADTEAERFCYTPSLGVYRATTGLNGDIMVSEDRIRQAMSSSGSSTTSLVAALDDLLGRSWDVELEPFRHAGEGAPVRWLHEVV